DKDSWMANLMSNGWGDRLDIYGTHYYPQWRPISGLQSDLTLAGSREKWHTELHWDNSADQLATAEEALVTMWDCTDNGMNGLMWWAYARTGLRGSIMRRFSTPLSGARPVPMDDVDGPGTFTLGKLQTRAFRRGNELTICALNLKTATGFPDQRFVLDAGAIGGNVQWRQWTDAGPDAGNTGSIVPTTSDSFLLTLPARSLTVFTVPYAPDPPAAWYRFENDGADSSGNGNDGTLAGDTSFVSGRIGFAAGFDGAGDHSVVPRSVEETFSIDLWMKTTTPGPGTSQWYQGTGLVDAEVAGATTDFGVALIGGQVVFGIGQPDTTIISTTDVTDGRWHHVAAQRNAVTGEISLHVDGRLEASGTASTAARTAPPAIRIGGRQTGGNAFTGRLDEVRLHDRLLIDSDFPDHHLPTVTITALGDPAEQGSVPGSFRIAREPGISPYPFIDAVEDDGTWLQGTDGSGGSRSMTVNRPTDPQLRPNDGGTYFSATTGVWYRGVAAPQLGSLVVEPGTYTVSFYVGDNDPDVAFYSTEKNPIGGNNVGLTAAPDILPALDNTPDVLLQTLDPSISLSASVSAVPGTGEWVQWTLTYTVPEASPLIGRPLGFVFRKPNTTSPETNGCFDGPFVLDFTPAHPSGLVFGGDLAVPLSAGGTADGADFLQALPASVTIPAGQ
ncbi:MAG: LamG domain-containing protein, partial [Verrucomicrobiae bacterium]|nr:LamG domain-containing protein [Verrucomicrobiae bacterium]